MYTYIHVQSVETATGWDRSREGAGASEGGDGMTLFVVYIYHDALDFFLF